MDVSEFNLRWSQKHGAPVTDPTPIAANKHELQLDQNVTLYAFPQLPEPSEQPAKKRRNATNIFDTDKVRARIFIKLKGWLAG